jgi:hypothetical protein
MERNMTRREIPNIHLGHTWNSYVGSAQAALAASGFWQGETSTLMGLTGFAFHFQINEGICPSSPTSFSWRDMSMYAMDRLGVYSEAFEVAPGLNTEERQRARAIERIKASIDEGRPAIVWAPSPVLEFGVLCGYDDEDEAFSARSYGPPQLSSDPMLYDNLGRGEVPILFYQLLLGSQEVDLHKTRRQSLELAVRLWRATPEHPGRGQAGYGVLMRSLERKDFVPFGLAYNATLYADAKRHTHAYLSELCEQRALPGLERARDSYAKVAENFSKLSKLVPFRGPASTVDDAVVPELLSIARATVPLEDEARTQIGKALEQRSS